MRKILSILTTILLVSIVLAACNDDSEGEENTKAEVNESQEATDDIGEETGVEENEETDEKAEVNEDDSSGNGIFEVTEEDQLDLVVGDTGVLQTSIGTYELTVESAEIIGTELDGQETPLDELILLELTFKNIGNDVIIAEDIMDILRIGPNYEGSGYSNAAEVYDSVEKFTGELQPGEERSAEFIADNITGDEYYFRQRAGAVAAGATNQVVWTIPDEEARN